MQGSERLEAARYEASAMSAPRRAPGAPAPTLRAAPRTLRPAGDAALAAWELAAAGAAHGTAYMLPNGWHWLGTVIGDREAYVLTIGPGGARAAERYGSAADPEISQAEAYFAGRSETEAICPTPDAFANLLRGGLPDLEPELPALAIVPDLPVIVPAIAPEPMPEIVAPEIVAPLPWLWQIAAPAPEPPTAPQLGRRTLREWVRDQVRALVGPWLAEVPPQLQLPRMIRIDNGGPEPAIT